MAVDIFLASWAYSDHDEFVTIFVPALKVRVKNTNSAAIIFLYVSYGRTLTLHTCNISKQV